MPRVSSSHLPAAEGAAARAFLRRVRIAGRRRAANCATRAAIPSRQRSREVHGGEAERGTASAERGNSRVGRSRAMKNSRSRGARARTRRTSDWPCGHQIRCDWVAMRRLRGFRLPSEWIPIYFRYVCGVKDEDRKKRDALASTSPGDSIRAVRAPPAGRPYGGRAVGPRGVRPAAVPGGPPPGRLCVALIDTDGAVGYSGCVLVGRRP